MLVIKGNALWTKVFEPDTRFVPEGEYSIQVVVPETEAAEVCEQLENMAQAKLAEVVKEQPKLKSVLSTRNPFENDTDEAGNPTGNILFKTKMKARVKSRDGRVYEQKPAVVDAKRTPMDGSQLVGNGSLVKVAVEPVPYMMQSTKQVGVTLRLKAVQIINLVEYGNTASSIFDEEDGFVASAVRKDDNSDVFQDEVVDDAEGDF
jgi:hypothetical protein